MKGQGGGGTAKGGGKNRSGGGTVKIETVKERQTKSINDNIMLLRQALFEETGKDKDVTKDIAKAFMKYSKNGLNVSIEFATRLSKEVAEWAFDLVKENMEEKYDQSGYGWDDSDKKKELTEKGARFLIVRENIGTEQEPVRGDPVAFVHFRFTVQGEVVDKMAGEPSLYIYDIHVDEDSQRKGLGKHLLVLLELIARREKMKFVSIPVQLGDSDTTTWLQKTGRGFSVDQGMKGLGFDPDIEGFEVFSKELIDASAKQTPVAANSANNSVKNETSNHNEHNSSVPRTVFSNIGVAAVTNGVQNLSVSGPSDSTLNKTESVKSEGGESLNGTEVEGGWVCL